MAYTGETLLKLTPCKKFLPEKLTVPQLVKKIRRTVHHLIHKNQPPVRILSRSSEQLDHVTFKNCSL